MMRKPRSKYICFLPILFFGVILIIFAIVDYTITTNWNFDEIFGSEVFVGTIIFGIIGGIFIIAGIILLVLFLIDRKKSPDTDNYFESYTEPYDTTSLNFEADKSSYNPSSEPMSADIDWQKIEPMIYRGNVEGIQCSICKIYLNNDGTILKCKYCGSLFHDEHLVDWLRTNHSCPVCKQTLI